MVRQTRKPIDTARVSGFTAKRLENLDCRELLAIDPPRITMKVWADTSGATMA